ncbi:MAG: hypothetical protein NTX30_21410 [Deltaproteobacteria bacterium]|nr:hypothetical protein [Deltaproteobacteria bacterium]
MGKVPSPIYSPLREAIRLFKMGDIKNAQLKLGFSPELVNKEEFIQCMVSLQEGVKLFGEGRQPESIEHFKIALPFINKSTDKEAQSIINFMAVFSEGISRLLRGDAYGALSYLNISLEELKRINAFMPEFENIAIASKAAAFVALGRAEMNSGNIPSAESYFGKAYDQYEQLLRLLNPQKDKDAIGFVEVYASRIEVAIAFAFLDLQSLDLDDMDERLKSVNEDVINLQRFLPRIDEGPIKKVAGSIIIIHSILNDLHILALDLILSRSSINRDRIERFGRMAQDLFKAKDVAEKAGERGKGILCMIGQLSKLRRNLLVAGKIRIEDFGRFGGIIAAIVFVLILIVCHFLIGLSGIAVISYIPWVFLVSLIAGYGYSAIRFIPLLKLYGKARKNDIADN